MNWMKCNLPGPHPTFHTLCYCVPTVGAGAARMKALHGECKLYVSLYLASFGNINPRDVLAFSPGEKPRVEVATG